VIYSDTPRRSSRSRTMSHPDVPTLQHAIDRLLNSKTQSTKRLDGFADYIIDVLDGLGATGARGGRRGELKVPGFGRTKTWDVALVHGGKPRLLVSLKSILRNPAGTVPNRLDDLMGEVANVQHLFPEVVAGYVVVLDNVANKRRTVDKTRSDDTWFDYFERRLTHLAIRRPPVWSPGLLEVFWVVRIDSARSHGHRLVQPGATARAGRVFVTTLVAEMRSREPTLPKSPS